MAQTRFSGPVVSDAGFVGSFTGGTTNLALTGTLSVAGATTLTGAASAPTLKLTVVALGSLPAASAGNAGTIYFVSGTSSGNTLVFSNGTANIDVLTGVAVV
jgi:hypothetical protein